MVRDIVYLKISPMKRVMRFCKKGTLSPRYFGPYVVVKCIGKVSYELKLPLHLIIYIRFFNLSMLKKCIHDLVQSILPQQVIEVNANHSYEEVSVDILDQKVTRLNNKEVSSLKVLWKNQQVEKITLEAEDDMKSQYPYLFPNFFSQV